MFKLVEVSVGKVPSRCGASIPLAFQGLKFSEFLPGFFSISAYRLILALIDQKICWNQVSLYYSHLVYTCQIVF